MQTKKAKSNKEEIYWAEKGGGNGEEKKETQKEKQGKRGGKRRWRSLGRRREMEK